MSWNGPASAEAAELTTSYISADRKLADARASAERSAAVASRAMSSLTGQREMLLSAGVGLEATGSSLSHGERLMAAVLERATRKKLALLGVVGVLFVAVVLLLYLKLHHAFGSN